MARRTGNEALHTRVRLGEKLKRERSRAAREAAALDDLDDAVSSEPIGADDHSGRAEER